jgi:hypothetical protein
MIISCSCQVVEATNELRLAYVIQAKDGKIYKKTEVING